jgi:hypothetical protein
MALKEYLIGGLPADMWVGRRTKCTGKDSTRHPFRCKIRSMDGAKITIVPDGHRNTDVVDISDIVPWWSPNSDLKFLLEKQMKQSHALPAVNKQTTLELDLTMPREESLKDVTPTPLPPTAEAPVVSLPCVDYPVQTSTTLVTQPQLLIRSHTHDWIPVYQKYLVLLSEQKGILEMLLELDATLDSCQQAQQTVLHELQELGVEIIDTAKAAAAPKAAGARTATKKGRGAAADRINTWAEAAQRRLKRNPPEVIAGRLTELARLAKMSYVTFGNNIDRMSRLYGLRFTGDNGVIGRYARGVIRVTLA